MMRKELAINGGKPVRDKFLVFGKPIENACIESYNGKFRDERLNDIKNLLM